MKKRGLENILKKWTEDDQHSTAEQQPSTQDIKCKNQPVHPNIERTIALLKSIYSVPTNNDIKFRDIVLGGTNKKACIIYINTITDTQVIEEHILRPLLFNRDITREVENVITAQSITPVQLIKDLLTNINNGNTVLLIDGETQAYTIATTKFEGRSVEKSENEAVVKGPKEAFNEKAMANISLIRKKIRDENLIVESAIISERAKNQLYIMYIKDLANENIIDNMKERLMSLDADSIQNLSILEEYLDQNNRSFFPTILYTERPDRASSFLEEGHIVLIMDNSPASLILPATFWSFLHNAEDHYLRFVYGNFVRALRLLALLITLFISAIYVSVTNYHMEMIPADLLLAIAATREIVPFPSIVEIIIMEIAFELIREAGLRVPNPVGPTIGIVGALILGQAAVQANIVSPLVVIIVALGGLSSFAIGDIGMNYAIRLIRFLFIVAASLFGFFGMTALFVVGLMYMISIKSFGVPYLAPMTTNNLSSNDTFFRKLIKNERYRPGYLKPKDIAKK